MQLRRSEALRRKSNPLALQSAGIIAVIGLLAGVIAIWFNPILIGAVIGVGIVLGLQRISIALRYREPWRDLVIWFVLVYGAIAVVWLVWLLIL